MTKVQSSSIVSSLLQLLPAEVVKVEPLLRRIDLQFLLPLDEAFGYDALPRVSTRE